MVEDREMGVKWLANAGKIESAMANARYNAGMPTKKGPRTRASGVTYKYKMTKENPVYSPHIIIISRVLLFWGFWVRGPPGPR